MYYLFAKINNYIEKQYFFIEKYNILLEKFFVSGCFDSLNCI